MGNFFVKTTEILFKLDTGQSKPIQRQIQQSNHWTESSNVSAVQSSVQDSYPLNRLMSTITISFTCYLMQ